MKLYPLRSATTKASLNKLINKHFSEVIKLKAFFPTMPRDLGSPLGAYNCTNREMTSDLLLFDILSRTPASGVCVNCPNSSGFTAVRITESGVSY